MKGERWEHIKKIVDKALTLSGHEREVYLYRACRKNPEICTEIEELLLAIEKSEEEQFMEPIRQYHKELIAEVYNEAKKSASGKDFIGMSIGPYRVTEKVGSGGMGIVFKGERVDGEFHHQVAIKLIKKGFDTDKNIHRFKIEREILASLRHPNIAQLHDGGVTKDGLPYLIMEYIEGAPIDLYCNKHKLSIDQRLNLFKKICSVVQYAHNKLIVHRDLKTQNIYVTSEGNVKILDFGIAKLLDPKLAEETLIKTLPGQKPWTPQYAAPEQIKATEITTKTDIYALGVLLHKLLTDTYPLDLEGKSIAEIEEIIKEIPPTLASKSLANNPSKEECATNRKATVAELSKKLQGDLEALVLKATRKESEYRYSSVSQLLEDVNRYQSGMPLIARKGTWKYRASKFIRRHRTGLVATVLFLLAAICLTGFYTWRISQERDRAEVQAQKAEQVTEFMMGLFESNEPGKVLGDTITARQLLDRGVDRAEKLNSQPEVKAEMMQVIGQVYQYLGQFDKAESLLEKSLVLREQILGPNHPDVADSQLSLAILRYTKGNYNTEALFSSAVSTYRRQLPSNHPLIAYALTNQAIALRAKGDYAAAESLFREVLTNYSNTNEETSSTVSIALTYLGKLLIRKENYKEADSLLRKALTIRREISGNQHPVVANILDAKGELLLAQGEHNAAEQTFREALAIRRYLFEEHHPDIAAGQFNLGVVMQKKGAHAEAESLLQNALSVYRKSFDEEDTEVAEILRHLAKNRILQGDTLSAEHLYDEALMIFRNDSQRMSHPNFSFLLLDIADMQIAEGDLSRAVLLLREAYDIRQKILSQDDWHIAEAQIKLGACLTDLGRYEEAEPLLLEGYEYFSNKYRGRNQRVQDVLKQLVKFYNKWEKPEKVKIYKNELVLAISED